MFVYWWVWLESLRMAEFSLVPRPFLKIGKRVWCSERHFLSHGAWPYFVKNVIIAFSNLELEFRTPQSIWTTIQPGLQKLEMVAKSIGTAENRLWDMFSLFPIRSKYDCLCYAVTIRSSAIWLVISNLRLALPHVTRYAAQNTRPSSHMREGLSTRLDWVTSESSFEPNTQQNRKWGMFKSSRDWWWPREEISDPKEFVNKPQCTCWSIEFVQLQENTQHLIAFVVILVPSCFPWRPLSTQQNGNITC